MKQVTALIAVSVLAAVTTADYVDPHCGGRQVIVELFQWKWTDVAQECERFLAPWGYCGVQVSPPNEHVLVTSPPAPWWERYQPVSYRLVSRGGSEAEFTDMVKRCNAVGVRIYVDVVVNHMSGTEYKGQGSGGTPFDGATLSYPGVPYNSPNFHPGTCHVNDYTNATNVRDCYLLSLSDLDQSQSLVRQKIVAYFDHLLDLGVAGFRVDASKHMWPRDLAAIQAATRDTTFGGRPFYMHEVIDQNDGVIKVDEYYGLGRVTEFRYCQKVTEGVHDFNALQAVVDYGWGMADDEHALVFVDNHDNQRSHGGGGRVTTHKTPLDYRLATAFTLAWDYGFTRVMSSYEFGDRTEQGAPHNADYSIADVTIRGDGGCGGGWVCEHRWPSIRGMPTFRNAVTGTAVHNYYCSNDVVAFSRGNKGFFAMGKQGFDQTFQTGLPAGQYCDLISNCRQKVTVDANGNARMSPLSSDDPVVAFIAEGPTAPIEEGSGSGLSSAAAGEGVTGSRAMPEETETSSTTTTTTPIPTTAVSEPDFDDLTTPHEPPSICGPEWSNVVSGADHMVTPGNYLDPQCGGRQVIVELFQWKWTDVAKECENYLGPKGYCGVQVSPVTEHALITNPPSPWWERYQPVSYKIVSRSGDEGQFAAMVERCNAAGVRIYVDVQLNHMTGTERAGLGIAGTRFNGGTRDYPGVPYSALDFKDPSRCHTGDGSIHDYNNPQEVRDCTLLSLTDLDQGKEYVRQKQVELLNHLLDLGVAGFRLDASKHMWPADLANIESRVKDTHFGGRPFFAHEVIDLGGGAVRGTEYTSLGYVTEFKYSHAIADGVRDFGHLKDVSTNGMLDSGHALVFLDNHDSQREHSGANRVLTFQSPHDYVLAQTFTLAWNYGLPRVMSSFRFQSSDQGPPHDASNNIADVTFNADGTCSGGWVCEHRWPAIGNMVTFRNHVTGTDVGHFSQRGDVVGFARGTKGFFAMGKQSFDQTFQTGLPAGQYCDVISNCRQKVTVDSNGNARISPYNNDIPVVAFLVDGPQSGCDLNGNVVTGVETTAPPLQTTPAGNGKSTWKRTVILIERQTHPGENLFIRGGISHDHRAGCDNKQAGNPCSIPIRHRDMGNTNHFTSVNAWSKGDNYLDWYGPEAGQGSFQGQAAQGTPASWTSSDPNHPGHSEFNTYGNHYWLVDVDMDCSRTVDGYLELKAVVGGWEHDISGACTGPSAGSPPFASPNHIARCGFLNVYHFDDSACTIQPIP